MRFLLSIIFLLAPSLASADGGAGWLLIYGFVGLVIILALSLPILPFYLLRNKSNVVLFSVGILISIAYTFVINLYFPYGIFSMLGFIIFYYILFFTILGAIFFAAKRKGKDIFYFRKIFLHSLITGAGATILTISYSYFTLSALYQTDCNINLVLNSKVRRTAWGECVMRKAIDSHDPGLCNKLGKEDIEYSQDYCKRTIEEIR